MYGQLRYDDSIDFFSLFTVWVDIQRHEACLSHKHHYLSRSQWHFLSGTNSEPALGHIDLDPCGIAVVGFPQHFITTRWCYQVVCYVRADVFRWRAGVVGLSRG